MPHESTRIDLPYDGHAVAFEVLLGRFARAPIGGNRREVAHDQRFDVGLSRFLIVGIRANVSDVRIGQTDDLPGVTGVSENFLVAGKTGIENDFAAAADASARRASVKDSPVLEREYRATFGELLQCVALQNPSSATIFRLVST
jgi:hypothetical protein